jgi:hypothetical protein
MKKRNRRRFLFASLSLAAVAATLRFTKRQDEKKLASPTGRFLTQDGQLVEIDIDQIPITRQAASKKDIQSWIKKNKSL